MVEKILEILPVIWAMEELDILKMLFGWAFCAAFFGYVTLKLTHNYFLSFILHQCFIFFSIYSLLVMAYKTIDLMFLVVSFAVWIAGMMSYGLIVKNTYIPKKYY